MEATLVCLERRDLSVVPFQAGSTQTGLAAQKGGWIIYAFQKKLEETLVCPQTIQAHVL